MNITKDEALESLNEIENVVGRTRRALAQGATSKVLQTWGIVWFLGYLTTQFAPQNAGTAWLFLDLTGMLVSFYFVKQRPRKASSPNALRIGLFWLFLFGYATFWFFLLHSESVSNQQGFHWVRFTGGNNETITRQSGAFFSTVAMFAYVIGGLWVGRFFIWLGLVVTVLTAIGYVFLPQWFNLWMAVVGGSSLFGAGLYMRTYWR